MSTNVQVVNLTGEVVLSQLPAYRDQLRRAIDHRPVVLASVSQVAEIDLFGVQLILAAGKYADAQGHEFHLTGTVPQVVSRRLHQGGFIDHPVTEAKELGRLLFEGTDEVSNG
jgi:anti-anti-sigma regulatory factor